MKIQEYQPIFFYPISSSMPTHPLHKYSTAFNVKIIMIIIKQKLVSFIGQLYEYKTPLWFIIDTATLPPIKTWKESEN